MKTPICDFVREYEKAGAMRLHMPGHKGQGMLGIESGDITEIDGADSLYEANGIIAESEKNAGALFGAHTFYSTEGSSLCIRAMLYLAVLYARREGKRPVIWSGRNAHRVFMYAVASLDIDVEWIAAGDSYLSCAPSAEALEKKLCESAEKPIALYLTSPDYLGVLADIEKISEICHRYGVLLLVDNAHGAYLGFLPASKHPIALGADMCSDSAHKTLTALTGAAYLHISKASDIFFAEKAREALAFFGSTSPSYLILQSLDRCNAYIADGYRERLADFNKKLGNMKCALQDLGYALYGEEPLKLTVCPKGYGYTGKEFSALLLEKNMVCEFSDRDFTVMMLTPEMSGALQKLYCALAEIPRRAPIIDMPPRLGLPKRAVSPRTAVFSLSERIAVSDACGRVLANASFSCPPAVPIAVCGEIIDENVINAMKYYGISECDVIKKGYLPDFGE